MEIKRYICDRCGETTHNSKEDICTTSDFDSGIDVINSKRLCVKCTKHLFRFLRNESPEMSHEELPYIIIVGEDGSRHSVRSLDLYCRKHLPDGTTKVSLSFKRITEI